MTGQIIICDGGGGDCVPLVTGLKHDLGPFESYGKGKLRCRAVAPLPGGLTLETQLADAEPIWVEIAARHGLAEC